MSRWVRVAMGSSPDVEFIYLNLDHVRQARVVPTVAGPDGFTVEFVDGGSELGSLHARWDTADHADNALQLLFGGVSMVGTTGQEA